MEDNISELDAYRAVAACREALREAVANALDIADGGGPLVRTAFEAELACCQARLAMTAPAV